MAVNRLEQEKRHGSDNLAAITAVICTHNHYDVVPDAIASLETQSVDPAKLEILIVDNSTDLRRQDSFWSSHPLPPNGRLIVDRPGLSRARNTALAESRSPLIAFLDDDAVAVPAWCAALQDAFDRQPNAAIAGGPVETIWPDRIPEWLEGTGREEFLMNLDLGDEPRLLDRGESLSGTNIAFRRPVLEAAGGFDEFLGRVGNSLLSSEETAVAARIRALGYEACYEPGARVLHRPDGTHLTQHWQRRRAAWMAVSNVLSRSEILAPEQCWEFLFDFLSRQPQEMRGARGLFLDTPDPQTFLRQCRAITALVQFALNHGTDPEAR